jgi:Putative amidase domain/IPT/TIG domain
VSFRLHLVKKVPAAVAALLAIALLSGVSSAPVFAAEKDPAATSTSFPAASKYARLQKYNIPSVASKKLTAKDVVSPAATPAVSSVTLSRSASGAALASVRGGDQVTLSGTGLDGVAGVKIGAYYGTIVSQTSSSIVFSTPSSKNFQPLADRGIRLLLSDGSTLVDTGQSFSYKLQSSRDMEMAYVLANFGVMKSTQLWPYLTDNDCANFVSQSLLAWGLSRNTGWYSYSKATFSKTWTYAPSLYTYLTTVKKWPVLTDTQKSRAKVQVGDIVFFDNEPNGNANHVGIVSRIVTAADGTITTYYAAHTNARDYMSVDSYVTWAKGLAAGNKPKVRYVQLPG